MQKPVPFFFGELYDSGEKHPPMLGQFSHRLLIVARLQDGSCEWRKRAGESASEFQNRIVSDLREMAEGQMAREAAQ